MTEVFSFRELKDAIDDSRYEYKLIFMTVPHCMKCKNVKKKFLKWPQRKYNPFLISFFIVDKSMDTKMSSTSSSAQRMFQKDEIGSLTPGQRSSNMSTFLIGFTGYVSKNSIEETLFQKGDLKGEALYNMSSGITALAEERLSDLITVVSSHQF